MAILTAVVMLLGLGFSEARMIRIPGPRIVGGQDATVGQFKYQLMLREYDLENGDDFRFICGAVLISNTTALTAAHCCRGDRYIYQVVAGKHHTHTPGPNEVVRGVICYPHPEYDESGDGYPHDIAILELFDPILATDFIEPIDIARDINENFVGEECIISGWGLTEGGSHDSLPEVLQHTTMPVISNAACDAYWWLIPGATIRDTNICVQKSGMSACSGDSGGPMVCRGVLAGITSWGSGACALFPSVYTRVSSYAAEILAKSFSKSQQ